MLRYLITVANTGLATVNTLIVADTLSPLVTGVASAQDAPFGAPVVTDTAGGSLYVWTASSLGMGPNKVYSFTLTGWAGWVCAPALVTNTAYAVADGPCGSATLKSPMTATTVQPHVITVQKTQTPPAPNPGDTVTYRMVVSNTGDGTIFSWLAGEKLVLTDTIASVVQFQSSDLPPGYTGAGTGVTGGMRMDFFPTSDCQLAPGTGFTWITCQNIFDIAALFNWIMTDFA